MKKLLCSVIIILLALGFTSCEILAFQYASDKAPFEDRVGTKWVCSEPQIELEVVSETDAKGNTMIDGEQVYLKLEFHQPGNQCDIYSRTAETYFYNIDLKGNYDFHDDGNKLTLSIYADELFNDQYDELTFYLQE
ncbi:MAG: hypothetical protein IKS19_06920 [Clostridia bacterium]|nr:hypothetical protein [Clostridia bacterium]